MPSSACKKNEGNSRKWPSGPRQFMEYLKAPDKATGRPYSARYTGCLVADVHRILLGGGIYLYPGETDKPEGKLRLLYEANPLAMLVEQAGGQASTGTMRILEVEPKTLHQRVPRSEEHTSELQSQSNLVCRLLLEQKKTKAT